MAPHFAFGSDAVPAGSLKLHRMQGRERVSGLFEISLEVRALDDKHVVEDAMADLLSKPAHVGREGAPPSVFGVVREVELVAAAPSEAPTYRITLVPRLWVATQTSRTRIFQDLTVPDIVKAVLGSLGFLAEDYAFRVGEMYPKREFVMQYEESDFDFVCRLCEREGIFYWFEHGEGRDRVVFADANGAARDVPAHKGVGFAKGAGGHGHAVVRLGRRMRRVPERVDLLDYNWRTPSQPLASSAKVPGGTTGAWTDTDEHYRDKAAGERLARVRAEELAATRVVYDGASDIESLRAGDLLGVQGHLVAALDLEYFVLEVRYDVSQIGRRDEAAGGAYSSEFVAIDARTPYRPPRTTRLPRIDGVVYATVDGPDTGAAAPIDAQGRYKILYPFDTSLKGTGRATRWVRMAQSLSGGGFGVHFPLRVGAEVILVHVNGDPDRPIIAGAVPNGLTPSPVVQRNATQSVIQTNAGIRVELEDHAG